MNTAQKAAPVKRGRSVSSRSRNGSTSRASSPSSSSPLVRAGASLNPPVTERFIDRRRRHQLVFSPQPPYSLSTCLLTVLEAVVIIVAIIIIGSSWYSSSSSSPSASNPMCSLPHFGFNMPASTSSESAQVAEELPVLEMLAASGVAVNVSAYSCGGDSPIQPVFVGICQVTCASDVSDHRDALLERLAQHTTRPPPGSVDGQEDEVRAVPTSLHTVDSFLQFAFSITPMHFIAAGIVFVIYILFRSTYTSSPPKAPPQQQDEGMACPCSDLTHEILPERAAAVLEWSNSCIIPRFPPVDPAAAPAGSSNQRKVVIPPLRLGACGEAQQMRPPAPLAARAATIDTI